LYYGLNEISYYCCGGGSTAGHIFMNNGYTHIFRLNNNGNVGIGALDPSNILQVGDGARLRISNGINDFSLIGTKDVDGGTNTRIVISGNTRPGGGGNIEYVATSTGNHVFYTTDSTTQRMIINSSGDVAIGTTINASYKLNVGGAINASGNSNSYLGGLRINGFDTGNTIWQDTGDLGISANAGYNMKFSIGNGGEKMRIKSNGNVGINTTDPQTTLQVNGTANITNGSAAGIIKMQSGSLTIGGTNANYGCQNYADGDWNGTNTAGLLMECQDNTEIVVHDNNTRLVSMIAYYGGANRILYIGRNMSWPGGATPVNIPSTLTVGDTTTLSGTLNLLPTTAITPLFIKSTAANSINNIEIKNNADISCYIGIGGTNYGGNYANNLFLQSPNSLILNTGGTGTGGVPDMIIDSAGNVGIGLTNPSSLLEVYKAAANTSYITISSGGTGGNKCGVLFTPARARTGGASAGIWGIDDGVSSSHLVLGTAPSGTASTLTERMRILNNGDIGINTTSPLTRLTLRMSYNDTSTGGFCIDSGDGNIYNLRLFSYVQAGSQVGYHFQVNNIASSVNALTFDYDGGVNINNLRIGNKSIYNNLFNSGGFGHETLTNFNNITDFGYRYINTPATNGPGTPTSGNQYYSWFIGLGTTYNYNTYGAQFAIPRKTANPVLSIRYLDDNGVWGSWSGITAAALTSGDKTISGTLTTTGNVGIGTNNPLSRLHIEHSSQSFNAAYGGLYVYNPNNTANSVSVLGARIAGSTASRAGVSLDVSGIGGWSIYMNGNDTVDRWLRFNSSWDASGTERLQINGSNGQMNINGNTFISGNLSITGNSTFSGNNISSGNIAARYFNNGQTIIQNNTASFIDVCAKFNGSIWVTSWIASSSDSRIKKNINDINDNSALLKILAIEPKTYNYIDNIEKGSNNVYGFIAQQIKEVIPEAINLQKSLIPNIFSTYDCSSNIINITSNIENLKVNDTISIIQENSERKNYTINEIIPETNQIKINENLEGSNCFVYGTEVDDFHSLNKDYIFTLNVCATQELHKIIQQQQQQIDALIRRIEILESR